MRGVDILNAYCSQYVVCFRVMSLSLIVLIVTIYSISDIVVASGYTSTISHSVPVVVNECTSGSSDYSKCISDNRGCRERYSKW